MSVPDWARRKDYLPRVSSVGPGSARASSTGRRPRSSPASPGELDRLASRSHRGSHHGRSEHGEHGEHHRKRKHRRRSERSEEKSPKAPREVSGRDRPWEDSELSAREALPRRVREDRPKEINPLEEGSSKKKVRLGKTTGLLAVGAWAARKEIASLIKQGFTSTAILRAIQNGDEEGPELTEKSDTFREGPSDRGKEGSLSSTPRGGVHSVVEPHRGALGSSSQAGSTVRPAVGHFRKQAAPPSPDPAGFIDQEEVDSSSREYTPSIGPATPGDQDEVFKTPKLRDLAPDLESFRKKAARPKEVALPKKGEVPPYIPKAFPRRANPSDQKKLDDYFNRARVVFESFVVAGVKMDLVSLVIDSTGDIDDHKFKVYTEPRSTGTGLRYARLMEKLTRYHEELWGGEKDPPSIISKENILKFLEYNIENECGFRTPKAILYAVEFFSVIFGFEEPGSRWPRCRKIADDYSRKAPERNPADFLEIPLLDYLERAVLDTSRSLAERVTCGKWRLCVQASIRHDDLSHTPLARTEWCRLNGGTSILGLRALAPTTKTGPRPWVASYLGVHPANDRWLSTFIELVLSVQGTTWKDRSFFVPGFLQDDLVSGMPSSITTDITIVKRMLLHDLEVGRPIPIGKEKVEQLRWHGCKASMPTYMTHFGVRGKVIRYQGNWAKRADSMPDTYLREAQVIVIKGQIEVLEKIRAGESISSLVGVGLGAGNPRGGEQQFGEKNEAGEIPLEEPREDRSAVAMEPVRVRPTVVRDELGRVEFVERELPDYAGFPDQLIDERMRALAERQVSNRAMFAELADENVESPFSKEEIDAATEIATVVGETPGSDESEASVEINDMEMLRCLVCIPKGKYHKPAESFQLDVPSAPTPMCKVSSARGFSLVNLEESLPGDAAFCVRCFGKAGRCQGLCTYTTIRKGVTLRCSRRCCLNCLAGGADADTRSHSCAFHVDTVMEDET